MKKYMLIAGLLSVLFAQGQEALSSRCATKPLLPDMGNMVWAGLLIAYTISLAFLTPEDYQGSSPIWLSIPMRTFVSFY